MGRSVNLWKVEETGEHVIYCYGATREQTGRLTIDKQTGAVASEPVEGMSQEDSWFFFGLLAQAKAEKLFAKGEYPSESHIAA
jgi:hypothetical protein